MKLLDLLTFLSYIGLNLDLVLQARKIRRVGSSEDISLIGLGVRFVAIFIILLKLIYVGDIALIAGQALIAVTFIFYVWLVIHYLPTPKRRR